MDRIKTVLDQYAQRKAERSRLNELWEEIAEVLAPERCGFIGSQNSDRYQTRIYDTTPIVAKRGLVSIRSSSIVMGAIGSNAVLNSRSTKSIIFDTSVVSIVVKARPSILRGAAPLRPPRSSHGVRNWPSFIGIRKYRLSG
mgnify:CR=1 FL=1